MSALLRITASDYHFSIFKRNIQYVNYIIANAIPYTNTGNKISLTIVLEVSYVLIFCYIVFINIYDFNKSNAQLVQINENMIPEHYINLDVSKSHDAYMYFIRHEIYVPKTFALNVPTRMF